MAKTLFIRHGETDWNNKKIIQGQIDIPLNENGKRQARACGIALKSNDYDLIISSPLSRALSTAKIINQSLEIPLIIKDFLKERSFGLAEGMDLSQLNQLYPDRIYPDMEARLDLNKRVIVGMNHLLTNYPNKKIIVVAHGAVLNSLLSTVTNHQAGSTITTLKNGSFTQITFNDSNWTLDYINQVAHLKTSD